MNVSKRLQIKMKHWELVKKGEYKVAYRLYKLLKDGSVYLGLGDVDWTAEIILEKMGCACNISMSSSSYTAVFYDHAPRIPYNPALKSCRLP